MGNPLADDEHFTSPAVSYPEPNLSSINYSIVSPAAAANSEVPYSNPGSSCFDSPTGVNNCSAQSYFLRPPTTMSCYSPPQIYSAEEAGLGEISGPPPSVSYCSPADTGSLTSYSSPVDCYSSPATNNRMSDVPFSSLEESLGVSTNSNADMSSSYLPDPLTDFSSALSYLNTVTEPYTPTFETNSASASSNTALAYSYLTDPCTDISSGMPYYSSVTESYTPTIVAYAASSNTAPTYSHVSDPCPAHMSFFSATEAYAPTFETYSTSASPITAGQYLTPTCQTPAHFSCQTCPYYSSYAPSTIQTSNRSPVQAYQSLNRI